MLAAAAATCLGAWVLLREHDTGGLGLHASRAPSRPLPRRPSLTARSRHTPSPAPAAYGLTLVWAFVAVYEETESTAVSRTALGAIVVLAVLSIASVLRRPGPEPRYEHTDAHEPLRPSLDGP